jgi:hypothetical protein
MAVRADVRDSYHVCDRLLLRGVQLLYKTSAEMRQHRRAEIVYDQISDDEVGTNW